MGRPASRCRWMVLRYAARLLAMSGFSKRPVLFSVDTSISKSKAVKCLPKHKFRQRQRQRQRQHGYCSFMYFFRLSRLGEINSCKFRSNNVLIKKSFRCGFSTLSFNYVIVCVFNLFGWWWLPASMRPWPTSLSHFVIYLSLWSTLVFIIPLSPLVFLLLQNKHTHANGISRTSHALVKYL